MTIRTLTGRLVEKGLLTGAGHFDKDVKVSGLSNDSREIRPNMMFVAIRGDKVDGHLFIDKAVKNGAIAVVCETVPGDADKRFPGTVFATVSNARSAWAHLSSAYYADPSNQLTMVGTTGTNGKSTTAYLIHHTLSELGRPCGLVGTIHYCAAEAEFPASLTTPDALVLHQLLRRMVDAGCSACSMEVSSHALAQNRTNGIDFDVAVFTNLTQDHLDFHGDLQSYLETKKTLFTSLGAGSTAVYNMDDPAGSRMMSDSIATILSYGQMQQADIRFEILGNDREGLCLRLDGYKQTFRLVGRFNAYNLSAAYSAARALDYQSGDILEVLAAAPPVPGRFEQIRIPDGRLVIVDYAHTPDALDSALAAARELLPTGGRVICVFGCGGDRDTAKRPLMGSIAEGSADVVIVTSDNPRTEDPEKILSDVRRGFDQPESAYWIPDRRAAIAASAGLSRSGDIVLIAGKGHEPYQVIGTEKIHLDDREVARAEFGADTTIPS